MDDRPQRGAGAGGHSPRLPDRRWYRLLLLVVIALQMGFQLLDLLTLQVIELGAVILDLPLEAEFRTDGQLLRDVLLRLLRPLESGDLGLDQPLLRDCVVAHDRDHGTVTVGGDLHDALVGEFDLQLPVLLAPGARQGGLVVLLVAGRRRGTGRGQEARPRTAVVWRQVQAGYGQDTAREHRAAAESFQEHSTPLSR